MVGFFPVPGLPAAADFHGLPQPMHSASERPFAVSHRRHVHGDDGFPAELVRGAAALPVALLPVWEERGGGGRGV